MENELLNESGIRIPKGTQAAKVIFHEDLDGVMSAILTVNQLVRQGIPKDKIRLASIQFGNNNELVKKKLSASKGQMVALVDFPRLPKEEGIRTPDFWSDHHPQSEEDKKQEYEIAQEKKGIHATKVRGTSIYKKYGDLSGATETVYKPKKERFFRMQPSEQRDMAIEGAEKGFTKELFDKYTEKAFEEAKRKDGWNNLSVLIGTVTNWKNVDVPYLMTKVANSKIDPEGKKKILNFLRTRIKKEKKITEAVGKSEYKSEAEHLATVHAQGLMDSRSIEAISREDSANYTNLADVVDLPKNFREKNRLERVAILARVLIGPLLKNPNALNKVIMDSSPSIVSVYNNLLKVRKLNNRQYDAIKELAKENPDWKKIERIRENLPPEMAKDVVKGKKGIMKMDTLEKIREKRQKDVEKHTDPEKTKFKKGNDYVIIQTSMGKGQPQRFLGSLLTKQSGDRYPAVMREWSTMFQISLNPDLKPTDKEKFDLTKGLDNILGGVIRDVNSGKIKVRDKGLTNWALTKVIRPEAGGHAGIATAGSLGTLGLAPKNVREEVKKLQNYERRVKALRGTKSMKDIMPKSAKELERLKGIKKEFAEEREMLVAEIKKRILDGIERSMNEKGVEAPKGEERFKVKKKSNIKEEIQWATKTMRI